MHPRLVYPQDWLHRLLSATEYDLQEGIDYIDPPPAPLSSTRPQSSADSGAGAPQARGSTAAAAAVTAASAGQEEVREAAAEAADVSKARATPAARLAGHSPEANIDADSIEWDSAVETPSQPRHAN